VIDRAVRGLLVCCLVTALLAGFSLSFRYRAESKNRAVGITLELETIQGFAASAKVSLDEALDQLKVAGLTGVVMAEESIGDIIADGRASVIPEAILLTNEDPTLRSRVAKGLERRFNMFVPNGGATIPIPGLNGSLARTVAIGLDDDLAARVKSRGLFIVARMSNPAGVTSNYVWQSLADAAAHGTKFFLPQGDQVLGRRDALPALLGALEKHQIYYATPEFTKIGGDANVVAKAPQSVVRLHSAQAAELDKLTLGGALERYGKAASERNQRILLLRPLSFAAENPLVELAGFVKKVSDQVKKEGLVPGEPHPFVDPAVPSWLLALISLSIIPALWFGAKALQLDFSKSSVKAAFALAALVTASGAVEPGRNYAALIGAMLYPTLALALLIVAPPKNVFIGYLRTSLISLVGGFVVAGLLNGLPFLVKADSFSGVKIAHFLPLAGIGLWAWGRDGRWRNTLGDPIRWGQAVLGLVLMVGLAFMATRTGNDSPAGVSGVELQFRALLDQWLYVRPRTKEFLIGHPVLVMLLGWLVSQRERALSSGWLALGIMVAAIGQTSIVNTLCHLHTPLHVGLTRILVGFILGGILGALGWGVWARWAPKQD